jgi:diamine N-acetyltransferase
MTPEDSHISIRPATKDDRREVFSWLISPGIGASMFGAPLFPDNPAPTWEEFVGDYISHYFDDSAPLKGRCFIIMVDGNEVGQVNYNAIFPDGTWTELDIWLVDETYTGKGYGTAAINLLCDFLKKEFGCQKFYMQPSRRNPRAIRAYEKAGFRETDEIPENFVLDFNDSVVMVKE